ncbi:hypothetical protein [Streptomyces tailanensis]|uniref:hypothetical protein n=1 Tax=Streptomyces tailanensis TaxID=2569858 RepID=UPI00122E696D|nr:hypothetical protein [Streptomyces tailanensis]
MIGEQPPEVSASGDRAMAAGGSIGVAISGDNTRVVLLPPEAVHWARTVRAPAEAGYLPGSAGVRIAFAIRWATAARTMPRCTYGLPLWMTMGRTLPQTLSGKPRPARASRIASAASVASLRPSR